MVYGLPARIEKSILPEPNSGCWLWTAGLNIHGYGTVWVDGKTRGAHRWIFNLLRGPISKEFDLDHLCRVRSCVNPDHLEPVSSRTNNLRGIGIAAANAKKTHCVNGHEFTAANTYWRPDRPGTRDCKECNRNLRSHK